MTGKLHEAIERAGGLMTRPGTSESATVVSGSEDRYVAKIRYHTTVTSQPITVIREVPEVDMIETEDGLITLYGTDNWVLIIPVAALVDIEIRHVGPEEAALVGDAHAPVAPTWWTEPTEPTVGTDR